MILLFAFTIKLSSHTYLLIFFSLQMMYGIKLHAHYIKSLAETDKFNIPVNIFII